MIYYSRTFILANQAKLLSFRTLILATNTKTFSCCAYNFIKMPKKCKTCIDSCDMQRYSKIIWICQHETSPFKKHLNISTVSCLLVKEKKISCFWAAKIKSRVKVYHYYNNKHIIGKKHKYLREKKELA